MSSVAWWQRSATQLRQDFLHGATTPSEVLDSCLARIDQVQPVLNAFVHLRAEAARSEAHRSSQRYAEGRSLGPLDGIPVSIKDNLITADMPTVWGSPGLRQHQSLHDELAVQRLRAQGAVIVGKTNVPEFTLEGYTDNPVFGPTVNPWDTARTPGGSSGGAAASIAAGCTPLALGTDGGGSIRRPAAHCGVVGLKPTIGTIARDHTLPSLLLDFEVVGLMARSTDDVQTLLHALRGPDPADRSSWAAMQAHQQCAGELAVPRVLYVPTLDAAPVDPAIATACAAAVEQAVAQGYWTCSTGELPLALSELNAAWPQVAQMGLAHLFDAYPSWASEASPKYRAMAAQGKALDAAQLWAILEAVGHLRRACSPLFAQWDAVVMPCTAAQPWPAQQAFPSHIAGQAVGPRGHAVFTGWVNAAGLPAISVPLPADAQGLPIGLQLVGPPGSEDRLLQMAQTLEQAQALAPRWPLL